MSKYEPLARHLGHLEAEHWRPTFHELERLLGFDLPGAARKRTAWWTSEGGANSPARAWRGAGWSMDKVDLAKEIVSFMKNPADDATAAAPEIPGARETPAAAASRLADSARAGATRLAEHAQGRAGQLAQEARNRAQAARESLQDGAGQAADLVRARPAVTLGVSAGLAFAAGVALGMLLVPRSRGLRDRAADYAHEHAEDALAALKAGISRLPFPDRRAAAAPIARGSRIEDLLHAVKERIGGLPMPNHAAETARAKAEDALHALREGVKDLRSAAMERLHR